MAENKIRIEDHNGNVYYPQTKSDVVFMKNGKSVESEVASHLADDTKHFTTVEKQKLAGIQIGATNYQHPSTHSASMITGLHSVATSGDYNSLKNKPSSLPASGGNADTVDGKHFEWLWGNGSPTHIWGSNNDSTIQRVFNPNQIKVGAANNADTIGGYTAAQLLAAGSNNSVIKSIQRGVHSGNAVDQDIEIPIPTINALKSFVVIDVSRCGVTGKSSLGMLFSPILKSLSNTKIITSCSAGTNDHSGPIQFSWQVIEFN